MGPLWVNKKVIIILYYSLCKPSIFIIIIIIIIIIINYIAYENRRFSAEITKPLQ